MQKSFSPFRRAMISRRDGGEAREDDKTKAAQHGGISGPRQPAVALYGTLDGSNPALPVHRQRFPRLPLPTQTPAALIHA